MPDMEECNHGKRDEHLMCFTFEEGKRCIGASGRKLRRVCIYCPNWIRNGEKEGRKDNEKDYGDPGGDRRSDRFFFLRTAADNVGFDRGDEH